jgi:Sortase domain
VGTFGHGPRSRRVLALDLLAVGLVVAGLTGLAFGRPGGAAPVNVSGTLSERGSPMLRAAPHHALLKPGPVERTRVGIPSRLTIPAVSVSTDLVRLGLNPDGSLEVPADFGVAGWYALGPRPGEAGAAVIVGHLDSRDRPGVFYRLGEVAPGDLVSVASSNRPGVSFRVYAVREYPKAAFPTSLVYGRTETPELRLITCGGAFDEGAGHYLDNVVVFARQVASAARNVAR